MGLDPNTSPRVEGTACPLCDAVIFDNVTPAIVQVDVVGVNVCVWLGGPSPNGTFQLPQVAPCLWVATIGIFTYRWSLNFFISGFEITRAAISMFVSTTGNDCPVSFVNQSAGCLPGIRGGTGGTAIITLPPIVNDAFTLLKDYNLAPLDKTWYEPYGESPPKETIRIAKRSDHTGALIRYRPNLL